MSDDIVITTEQRGAVRLVTLNRPAKLNAWTPQMEVLYADALEVAERDPEVRAVVVTGAGRAFCAGADMSVLAGTPGADTRAAAAQRRPAHAPLTFRKPLIAAVNGAAAGVGFVQALYADVRFAGPSALFLTSFAHRGLIAEYGVSWLLPQIIGRSRSLDLLLSSRAIGGEEAHGLGLVDHLVSDSEVVDAAVEYAQRLAELSSPTSMAIIKEQVLRDADGTFLEAAARADELMHESFRGRDLAEGVASFTQRRAPRFASLPTRR